MERHLTQIILNHPSSLFAMSQYSEETSLYARNHPKHLVEEKFTNIDVKGERYTQYTNKTRDGTITTASYPGHNSKGDQTSKYVKAGWQTSYWEKNRSHETRSVRCCAYYETCKGICNVARAQMNVEHVSDWRSRWEQYNSRQNPKYVTEVCYEPTLVGFLCTAKVTGPRTIVGVGNATGKKTAQDKAFKQICDQLEPIDIICPGEKGYERLLNSLPHNERVNVRVEYKCDGPDDNKKWTATVSYHQVARVSTASTKKQACSDASTLLQKAISCGSLVRSQCQTDVNIPQLLEDFSLLLEHATVDQLVKYAVNPRAQINISLFPATAMDRVMKGIANLVTQTRAYVVGTFKEAYHFATSSMSTMAALVIISLVGTFATVAITRIIVKFMRFVLNLYFPSETAAIAQVGDDADIYDVTSKIIATSLVAGSAVTSKNKINDFMRNSANYPRAHKGLAEIAHWIKDCWDWLVNLYRTKILGMAPKEEVTGESSAVTDWLDRARSYLTLDNFASLDRKVFEQFQNTYYAGVDLLRIKNYSADHSAIQRVLNAMTKVMDKIPPHKAAAKTRDEPTTIYCFGDTSVGKSACTKPLAVNLLTAIAKKKNLDPNQYKDVWADQIYSRNSEQVFWDGYRKQKICVFDDFSQKVDSPTSPNLELFEVIRAVNTFEYPLHMADISEKSNTKFESDIVIASSNLSLQAVCNKSGSLNFPNALKRRFDVVVKVTNDLPPEEKGKFTTEYYRFDIVGQAPNRSELNKKQLTWDELVDYLADVAIAKEGFSRSSDAFIDSLFASPSSKSQMGLMDFWKTPNEEHLKIEDAFDAVQYRFNPYEETVSEEIREEYINTYLEMDKDEFEHLARENNITRFDLFKSMFMERTGIEIEELEDIADEIEKTREKHSSTLKRFYTRNKKALKYIAYTTAIITAVFGAYKLYTTARNFLTEPKESTNAVTAALAEINCDCAYHKAVESGEASKWGAVMKAGKWIKHHTFHIHMEKDADYCWNYQCANYWNKDNACNCPTELTISHGKSCDCCDAKRYRQQFGLPEPTLPEMATKVSQGVGFELYHPRNNGKIVRLEMKGETSGLENANSTEQKIAEAQGIKDLNSVETMDKILRKGLYRMLIDDFSPGMILFVKGRVALVPKHFVTYFSSMDPTRIITFRSAQGVVPFKCTVQQFLSQVHSSPDKDFAFIYVSQAHIHADFTECFVVKSNIASVRNAGAMMPIVGYGKEGANLINIKYTAANSKLIMKDILNVETPDGTTNVTKTYRDVWEYDFDTMNGDCGSPLIIRNTQINPGKVVGIHIAGIDGDTARGYSVPLYKEDVDEYVDKFKPIISVNETTLAVAKINVGHPYPDGSMIFMGTGKTPSQPTETKEMPSIFYGKLEGIDVLTKPCTLNRALVDGEYFYPMKYRMQKYARVMEPIDEEKVKLAEEAFAIHIERKIRSHPFLSKAMTKPLSYDDTIKGVDGRPGIPSIKRNTSTGYPYCLDSQTTSRKRFFGDGMMLETTSDLCQALIRECKEIETNIIDKNEIPPFVFVDCVKDERKPIAKAHKSRVFSNGPLNYLILCKRYYNPILELIHATRNTNGISVGSNPYSMDWHVIAKELLSKSEHIIAGDFEGFDSSQHSSLISSSINVLVTLTEHLLDFSQQDLRVMRALGEALYNSYHCHEGKFFQWTHGMVSGSYFTADVNSIFVNLAFCVCFLTSQDKKDLNTAVKFWQECGIVAYGDDHVVSVPSKYLKTFNQVTLVALFKSINLDYTMEDKDTKAEVLSRTIEEVSYLKRKFRYDESFSRYLGPISVDTITEMVQWTKKGGDTTSQSIETMKCALRELSLHDQKTWDYYYPKFSKALMEEAPCNDVYFVAKLPTMVATIDGDYLPY